MPQSDPYADYAEAVAPRKPSLKEDKLKTDVRQGEASADASGASAGETVVDTTIKRLTQPATVQEAFARARSATADADQKERTAVKDERAIGLARQEKLNSSDDVLQQINMARRLISGWSTGVGHSLLSGVPTSDARALNSILGPDGPVAANNLLKRMMELKEAGGSGGSGLGPLSNAEGQKLANSIASLDLGLSPEQVLNNLNIIDRSYRRAQAAFAFEHEGSKLDPRSDEAVLAYGIIPDEDLSAKAPETTVGGVDNQDDVKRPGNRAGLNSVVTRMVLGGRSAAEIKEYLNRVEPGLGDATKGLEWWEEYQKRPVDDPRAPRRIPEVDVETLRTEQSLPEKALGAAGDTGPGAFIIGGADFMTGGNLDAFSSNPEGIKAAVKGSAYERPDATAFGQIAGAVGQGMGMEGLAAKYGMRLGPTVMSALQEGLYGYGSSDSEGLAAVGDAAVAAGVGAVGGKAADLGMRGLARGVRGVTDEGARFLHSKGVSLTPGEMLGGSLKRFEEKAANWPVVGGMISSRLDEGRAGFNRAAFDDALGGLTEKYRDVKNIGVAGVRQSRKQVSKAFNDALKGVQLAPDNVYSKELQDTLVRIGEVDDVGPRVLRAIKDRLGDELAPGRTLTGPEVQGVLRKIDGVASQFRRNEMFESSIAPPLRELEGAVRGLVERQAPSVLPQYDAARGAWRKVSVLGEAASASRKPAAGQVGDERGVFDPVTLATSGQRNMDRFGGRGASVSREYPFEKLAEMGEDTLLMPRRSTSAAALPLAVGAGGTAAAQMMQDPATVNPNTGERSGGRDLGTSASVGLGLATLAGAPYSRFSRDTLQRLLMGERGAGAQQIGDLMLKYAPGLGSKAAVGAMAPMFGQELPETKRPAEVMQSAPPPEPQAMSVAANVEGPAAPGEDAPAYIIEVGGMRLPLSPGDWFDSKTGELVAADGTRIPLSAIAGQQ